ncbi:AMMECR1 domain-containing protein, partial [candidate division KSB1 bacterium]|nr:AMMECR1 domain-containing protein [candidate division KSB1 bacterium]NIT69909.1 AMMECR1 domain-containing protein [candidate division KSB1 bacterium]NIX69590.1 AMMECR1 domain-containing protein [candidate division KSB1 bacterium]
MHRFLTTEIAPLARGMDPVLNQKRGAFVSLKKKNNLRGCVGHMEPDIPLGQIIGAMTLQAAFNDPRFNSVSLDELSEIKI